jgi:hypothetical protein
MSASSIRLTHDVPQTAVSPFHSAAEHLFAELDWLRAVLQGHVLRLKAANLLVSDPFRGLYLADEQVDATLAQWSEQSQRTAPSSLAEVADEANAIRTAIDARLRLSFASGYVPPLARLASLFKLSPFECKALIAAIAPEIDTRFETLYSWARNDVTRRRPSVDLVLKLLCDSRDEEFAARAFLHESGALVRHQLVRLADDPHAGEVPFLSRSLRVDERIMRFVCAQAGIDQRLQPCAEHVLPVGDYDALYLPDVLRRELRNLAHLEDQTIVYLCGPQGCGKRSAVEALCAEAGRGLMVCDLARAMHAGIAAFSVLALLQRECILLEADFLLESAEALFGDSPVQEQFRFALEHFAAEPGTRVYVAGEDPWPSRASTQSKSWHVFDFSVPPFSIRHRLWQQALEEARCPVEPGVDLQSVANRFALTGGAIHQACADAARHLLLSGNGKRACSARDLEAAARAQSNHGLRRFARKVHENGGWSSLVLPPPIIRQLRAVCTAERYRHTVYSQWGFDQRLSSGKGLNVLFCGTSGTGKTMAAGILAKELGLDLYQVDLSIVVSKYIGETEKQLSQIFREAQTSNAVLLFDEADALFGKRSEVKDAHDRYANVEVAYLLQKMEEYEGIVILATNLRRNMDDAFTRRMHHIIEFPFPDAEHRERIWRGILPAGAPVAADLDFNFLARQFEFAGGNIRNIALAAAFFAAEEGTAIRMEHCIVAAALELQKNGKLPSRSEFQDYFELIRART